VVVLLHGWGGMNPLYYGAWIDHLVKRGNIVIYPRYQATLLTPLKDFTPNTLTAVKDALGRLQSEKGHVSPELNKFAAVGHSMGGLLAANLAALAVESKLPRVQAVMSVEPGITESPINRHALARARRRSGLTRSRYGCEANLLRIDACLCC
jgi:pimeloyl-ACP methyl ester carboxylesterase